MLRVFFLFQFKEKKKHKFIFKKGAKYRSFTTKRGNRGKRKGVGGQIYFNLLKRNYQINFKRMNKKHVLPFLPLKQIHFNIIDNFYSFCSKSKIYIGNKEKKRININLHPTEKRQNEKKKQRKNPTS